MTDDHAALAAACEWVGIRPVYPAAPRVFMEGREHWWFRSPADLLAELEGWLLRFGWIQTITRHRERCVVDWNTPFDQACAVGPSEKEAREKAAVAAVDKLKGKGV